MIKKAPVKALYFLLNYRIGLGKTAKLGCPNCLLLEQQRKIVFE
jgi:hypothetical protein